MERVEVEDVVVYDKQKALKKFLAVIISSSKTMNLILFCYYVVTFELSIRKPSYRHRFMDVKIQAPAECKRYLSTLEKCSLAPSDSNAYELLRQEC